MSPPFFVVAEREPCGHVGESAFARAFEQMRLDNTARVLPAAPLSKITRKSISLPRARPAPARHYVLNKCALTIPQ